MANFGIKSTIDKLFSNSDLITHLTVTKITLSNNNFDYGKVTRTEGTTTTINAVPANYIKSDMNPLSFGDLEEGDMRFFCKSDSDIEEDDKITFNSEEYRVKRISAYWVGGVIVAKILVIHNVLDR